MGNRRNRPPNQWGCKPDGDVCVYHDMPLACRHGCEKAKAHKCADKEREAKDIALTPFANYNAKDY